jgi:hypothetical protein
MIRPKKIVDARVPAEAFDEWEWGDGDLAPLLQHIRRDTAKVIADQIAEDCDGWFSDYDCTFNVTIFGDFIISFDVLDALAVGQIRFDDINALRAFAGRIKTISDNMQDALEIAEKSAS